MPLELTNEWLIVCEGSSDKAFFSELILKRALPSFQIQYPKFFEGDTSGGWTKYGRFLDGIKVNQGFTENLKAILVVADSDDDPTKRFSEIQEQIKIAGGYGVPDRPLKAAGSAGSMPKIVIMMIPLDGGRGNLETLLLPAAYSKWQTLEVPLETYIDSSPVKDWAPGKQSKARLRCLLTSTCMQDPNTSLGLLWTRPPEYHIPVEHYSLNEIADVLQDFSALIA